MRVGFHIDFMDCKRIKSIIPKYVNHSATEEEIGAVEEHLCICHECRQYLSDLFDKNDAASSGTGSLYKDKGFRKIDIFNIFVIAISLIIAFVSIWLFIKAH